MYTTGRLMLCDPLEWLWSCLMGLCWHWLYSASITCAVFVLIQCDETKQDISDDLYWIVGFPWVFLGFSLSYVSPGRILRVLFIFLDGLTWVFLVFYIPTQCAYAVLSFFGVLTISATITILLFTCCYCIHPMLAVYWSPVLHVFLYLPGLCIISGLLHSTVHDDSIYNVYITTFVPVSVFAFAVYISWDFFLLQRKPVSCDINCILFGILNVQRLFGNIFNMAETFLPSNEAQ
jgi:hypothetical protein